MKTLNWKSVVLCLMLGILSGSVFSQSKNQMEILQGKKWVWTNPSQNLSVIKQFGQSEVSQSLVFNNREHKFPYLYYLSDTIPQTFDCKEIGKCTLGKYLILLPNFKEDEKKDYTKMQILEIIELTSSVLKTRAFGNSCIIEYKSGQ